MCPAGSYVRTSPHNIYRHAGKVPGSGNTQPIVGPMPPPMGGSMYQRPSLGQALVSGVANAAYNMGAGYHGGYNSGYNGGYRTGYGGRIY